jgi:predicted nucleic acid-binding protein
MSGERFTLDTNILIYSLDAADDRRRERAEQVIARALQCDCWLTLQSVSEFYAAVTRKRLVSRSTAAAQANDWLEMFSTVAPSANAIRSALTISVAERASYWDALLVATAAEAGCTSILTEDMGDGMSLYDVRILNPFTGDTMPTAVKQLLEHG